MTDLPIVAAMRPSSNSPALEHAKTLDTVTTNQHETAPMKICNPQQRRKATSSGLSACSPQSRGCGGGVYSTSVAEDGRMVGTSTPEPQRTHRTGWTSISHIACKTPHGRTPSLLYTVHHDDGLIHLATEGKKRSNKSCCMLVATISAVQASLVRVKVKIRHILNALASSSAVVHEDQLRCAAWLSVAVAAGQPPVEAIRDTPGRCPGQRR